MPQSLTVTYKNPVQEKIIASACQHFEISEQELIALSQYNVAYMRQICFWLIKKGTPVSQKTIGFRFNRTEGPVKYGIDIIDSTKNIYNATLSDLKKIAEKAGISDLYSF